MVRLDYQETTTKPRKNVEITLTPNLHLTFNELRKHTIICEHYFESVHFSNIYKGCELCKAEYQPLMNSKY